MPNEQVDWVSLEDVMAAADRGLAPIGPELAGFVVLETAQRLRELGGVLDASLLAVGTSGHVALTGSPKHGDEDLAVQRLRQMLGAFLAVSTSSTPALRQCARRRDHNALATLCRELEGALIPLNRAASRRAVARVARATLEAIDSGRLEPGSAVDRSESEPSRVEVAPRRSTPPPLPVVVAEAAAAKIPEVAAIPEAAPEPTPEPIVEHIAERVIPEPMVEMRGETVEPPEVDERTPFTEQVFDEIGHTPLEALAARLETASPPDIEIVSQLPPIVIENDDSQRFALAVDLPKKADRVAALIETFEVSRRRDDRALSGDLKAMIGIETSAPPAVTVNVRLHTRGDHIDIDHEAPRESSVIINDAPPAPKRRRSVLAFLGLATIACGIAALAAKPAALDAILGPPLPPPGDHVVTAQPATTIAPRLPIVCEASLSLEHVPQGAEVLRRIGTTPLTVAMPMHVPFDLVSTMEGHAPRRAHVDASAIWQQEATGARLDVPFTLDAVATAAAWPTATGVVPLRANNDVPRGLLRATSTPNGATLWVVVDPAAITGVPCGGGVELMILAANKPRHVHVDWSTFSGSPPHANAKY